MQTEGCMSVCKFMHARYRRRDAYDMQQDPNQEAAQNCTFLIAGDAVYCMSK